MSDKPHDERTIEIVRGKEPLAEILIDARTSQIILNAALTLQQEIRRRTGAKLPVRRVEGATPATNSICLGTLGRDGLANQALAALGHKPASPSEPGREGFLLLSGLVGGKSVVVISGSDDLGTFHGVGWLLRRMRFGEDAVTVSADLSLATSPATWQRRIRFGDHFGYVNTELSGWKEIWSDYVLWGLSAVTMRCDPAHQGDPRETDLAKHLWSKWTERVPLARSLGLEVFHLTQSNLVAKDGQFGPSQIPNFPELNHMCPDFNGVNPKFPRGREVLRRFRQWFFDNMPHVEDISHLTNGWDGGGCLDPDVAPWACTYADLVDQIIYPLIAQHNADAQIILSTYACPDLPALAARMQQGWRPAWLAAIELDNPDMAALFPSDIRRVYFPMWTTDFYTQSQYQTVGVNPCPRFCQAMFDHVYHDCSVRDGIGCYSEGTHDFVNQVLMMQLAWDPSQTVDSILDDLCCYYFGAKAAPLVKEAFYLMERDMPDSEVEMLADPRCNPRIGHLVEEAEQFMPVWAKASRQWALVRGRASIVHWRRRQANLCSDFDRHWQRYQSLLMDCPAHDQPPHWLGESREYFQAVVSSGQEMVSAYKRMQRDGLGVLGGGQMALYPNPLTGAGVEAMAALESWHDPLGPSIPGRWCVAHLDLDGRVAVSDGWSNQIILEQPPAAADAQLAFADLHGDGCTQIVYLGTDGCLYSWSPTTAVAPLATGQFLTGPLAAADLDDNGKEEVLVLSGTRAEHSRLAVVDAAGRARLLPIGPAGLEPEREAPGVVICDTRPKQTTTLAFEPRIVVCDIDGDGSAEIICSDRDDNNRLVVLDGAGYRKAAGPPAPCGALTYGDLDGDGLPEVVFLDRDGHLTAYSPRSGTLPLGHSSHPKWASTVVVAPVREGSPAVVYADDSGMVRFVRPGCDSELLTGLPSTAAVGPGMVVGDYDGDGRPEVCYLRRRLGFLYPLSVLSTIDASGGVRDIPFGTWYLSRQRPSYGAPLGPRASGRMRFPTIEFAWIPEHGFHGYIDYPYGYVFGGMRYVPGAYRRKL